MNNLIKLKALSGSFLMRCSMRSISSIPSINFSETHLMLKQTCKDFSDKELAPAASKIDKLHMYPESLIKQMGELGLNLFI